MQKINKLEEPNVWYDINNESLYKNLSPKEVFEWLENSNKFIWKSLTEEERKQKIENKINEGKMFLQH